MCGFVVRFEFGSWIHFNSFCVYRRYGWIYLSLSSFQDYCLNTSQIHQYTFLEKELQIEQLKAKYAPPL